MSTHEIRPAAGSGPAGRAPISSSTLGIGILLFVTFYQVIFMWIWIEYEAWDWTLLRISLSMADVIGYSALLLSFYAYWRFEKSTESEDMEYLHNCVVAMRKAGINPMMITEAGQFMTTVQAHAKAELGREVPITEVAIFMGRVYIPALVRKVNHANHRVKTNKCSYSDLQEAIL